MWLTHRDKSPTPIMQYVWDLEAKVNALKDQQKYLEVSVAPPRPFRLKWFAFGFLAGAAAVSVLVLLRVV